MTTEREQLELAAKACGSTIQWDEFEHCFYRETEGDYGNPEWNPLADDGDCARLEAQLGVWVTWSKAGVTAAYVGTPNITSSKYFKGHNGDKNAARRAASVTVAAEIGRLK